MLKMRSLVGLSLVGLGLGGYYQYHNSNSFRSVCNLAYAGAHITYIYKFTADPISRKNTRASQYLRDALRLNGGIYLKLGQLIATLDVIVPDQYRLVMGSLTRECERAAFEEVKATVEEELKFPLEVVFKSFDKEPISSASIGQVHRAVLLNGEKVAVKIQHRHLAGHVESDLAMLHRFVRLAKWLFTEFNYEWLVDGFEKNMRIELDFNRQAQNMKRTQNFLKENGFKDIYVPQVMIKPTKRVLVMEFIDGIHIDEIDNLKKAHIDMRKMGSLFSKMIIKMIHKEGFVHADTHSGNLMARKLKNGNDQLVLLDHGLYQEMDSALVRSYNQFWLGLILNDPKLYEPAARQLGTSSPQMLCSILTSKTMDELEDKNRSLFDLNPSSNKQKIMDEAAKNHEKIIKVLSQMKRQILLLLKTNEFARTLENMMSGRQMGVYQDIATECVQNLGFSTWTRWGYYIRMMRARNS